MYEVVCRGRTSVKRTIHKTFQLVFNSTAILAFMLADHYYGDVKRLS
jgi:hypothetical protein